jgi:hypothetical protein
MTINRAIIVTILVVTIMMCRMRMRKIRERMRMRGRMDLNGDDENDKDYRRIYAVSSSTTKQENGADGTATFLLSPVKLALRGAMFVRLRQMKVKFLHPDLLFPMRSKRRRGRVSLNDGLYPTVAITTNPKRNTCLSRFITGLHIRSGPLVAVNGARQGDKEDEGSARVKGLASLAIHRLVTDVEKCVHPKLK